MATLAARPVTRVAPASRRLWPMLFVRLGLFAAWQGIFAIGLALSGARDPLQESARWWLVSATFANLTTMALLAWLARAERIPLRNLLNLDRTTWRRDLLWVFGAVVVLAPLGYFPNPLLATLLFGDANAVGPMMFQPLPTWALLVAGVGFPLTVAFSELPLYYGYLMPRLKQATGLVWPVILLVASAHALQHIALPLVLDGRFMLWRFGMFLPFAIFVAWAVNRRPTLLPYLMVVHGLLDAQLVFLVPR